MLIQQVYLFSLFTYDKLVIRQQTDYLRADLSVMS